MDFQQENFCPETCNLWNKAISVSPSQCLECGGASPIRGPWGCTVLFCTTLSRLGNISLVFDTRPWCHDRRPNSNPKMMRIGCYRPTSARCPFWQYLAIYGHLAKNCAVPYFCNDLVRQNSQFWQNPILKFRCSYFLVCCSGQLLEELSCLLVFFKFCIRHLNLKCWWQRLQRWRWWWLGRWCWSRWWWSAIRAWCNWVISSCAISHFVEFVEDLSQ